MFAKVKGYEIIKFPYSYLDLLSENQNTKYDDRYDLSIWYSLTEESIKTEQKVIPVITSEPPNYNTETHILSINDYPEWVDNKLIIKWEVIARPRNVEQGHGGVISN